ncbi:MAG TPA: hypothetical protein VKP30_09920 [Polyangiaceae bacterium]|nr:hypothetical protein [Polyangiaceae bacterium]
MSEFTPLIKSHASARVRQLLASAELDRPPSGGKQRALEAVSAVEYRPSTTNFSGIALGTTVHRLIGAVTLYEGKGGPLRWIVRGGAVGVAVGGLLLATIVALRWLEADRSTAGTNLAAHVHEGAAAALTNSEALRRAQLELQAGRADAALELASEVLGRHGPSELQATLLKVKALIALGRVSEATEAAQPLLVDSSSVAGEVRELLSGATSGTPASTVR